MFNKQYQEEFENSLKIIKERTQAEDEKMERFMKWANEKAKEVPESVLSFMTYENYLLFEKEEKRYIEGRTYYTLFFEKYIGFFEGKGALPKANWKKARKYSDGTIEEYNVNTNKWEKFIF